MKNKDFVKLILIAAIYGIAIFSIIIYVNISIDAASVIRPQHTELAKLALAGNTVSVPENYNDRVFQVCIVNNIKSMPETVVIGSSRGMFLGRDITGYTDIYNNCVSGACMDDYYALLGLYYDRFGVFPKRVIIEISPWIFYKNNKEARWKENQVYYQSACKLYKKINKANIPIKNNFEIENPYISFSYFRYNLEQLLDKGSKLFTEQAHISNDINEFAEYPDGTIRYAAELENENEKRLADVKATAGACEYEGSNKMVEIDSNKKRDYENLIDYLQASGSEVIIFMQPFSATQSYYCFDKNMNPGYSLVNDYIDAYAKEKGIEVHGGYDAKRFNFGDERFIDNIHLDKIGTNIIWNYK